MLGFCTVPIRIGSELETCTARALDGATACREHADSRDLAHALDYAADALVANVFGAGNEPSPDFARAMVGYMTAVRADERAKYEALVEAGSELRYWLDCLTDHMRSTTSRAVKEWDDLEALHQQGGQ